MMADLILEELKERVWEHLTSIMDEDNPIEWDEPIPIYHEEEEVGKFTLRGLLEKMRPPSAMHYPPPFIPSARTVCCLSCHEECTYILPSVVSEEAAASGIRCLCGNVIEELSG